MFNLQCSNWLCVDSQLIDGNRGAATYWRQRGVQGIDTTNCEIDRRGALNERAMILRSNRIKLQLECEIGRSSAHNERAATLHSNQAEKCIAIASE